MLIPEIVEEVEVERILEEDEVEEALLVSLGDLTRASDVLGVPYAKLYRKVKGSDKLYKYWNMLLEERNSSNLDLYERIAHRKALEGDSILLWKMMTAASKNAPPARRYGQDSGEGGGKTPPQVTIILQSLQEMRNGIKSEAGTSINQLCQENKPA